MDVPSYYDATDKLLPPRIAAERLGVHRETLYRWMRSGHIRFVLPRGGGIRPRKLVRESEIQRHLEDVL